jgi:hypothetical protein
MGRRKNNKVDKVISVRVTGDELRSILEIMKVTQKSASNVMREAIRLFIAPTT